MSDRRTTERQCLRVRSSLSVAFRDHSGTVCGRSKVPVSEGPPLHIARQAPRPRRSRRHRMLEALGQNPFAVVALGDRVMVDGYRGGLGDAVCCTVRRGRRFHGGGGLHVGLDRLFLQRMRDIPAASEAHDHAGTLGQLRKAVGHLARGRGGGLLVGRSGKLERRAALATGIHATRTHRRRKAAAGQSRPRAFRPDTSNHAADGTRIRPGGSDHVHPHATGGGHHVVVRSIHGTRRGDVLHPFVGLGAPVDGRASCVRHTCGAF